VDYFFFFIDLECASSFDLWLLKRPDLNDDLNDDVVAAIDVL
jgi:hypothetical protein